MAYCFSASDTDPCPIAAFEAAKEVLYKALKSGSGFQEALRQYVGAEKAKRDSGWKLEPHH